MVQFIAILLFGFAIFVLAFIRTRKVMRNCVVVSFLPFVATLILWLLGQFNIENRLYFHGKGKFYCAIDSVGGKVVFSITRYDVMPLVITGGGCDCSPDESFYSIMEVDSDPQEPPRLFEKFGREFDGWLGISFSSGEPPEPQFCYSSIEVPYWFIALIFAAPPLCWFAIRRYSAK